MTNAGQSVDIFSAALDQTGIFELSVLSNKTGGHVMMCDSFETEQFKQTYAKYWQNIQSCGFNATLEVKTCQELQIAGVTGHCISLNNNGKHVSRVSLGTGESSTFRINSLTLRTEK